MECECEEATIAIEVVPMKGLSVSYCVTQLLKDIDKLGRKNMILKTDGEAASHGNQTEVQKKRCDETLLQKSPVRDSKANGIPFRRKLILNKFQLDSKTHFVSRKNTETMLQRFLIPKTWRPQKVATVTDFSFICLNSLSLFSSRMTQDHGRLSVELISKHSPFHCADSQDHGRFPSSTCPNIRAVTCARVGRLGPHCRYRGLKLHESQPNTLFRADYPARRPTLRCSKVIWRAEASQH